MTSLLPLINTALLAIGSAVLSGLVGYLLAPWLQKLGSYSRLVRTIWLLPFVLPAFLMGLFLLPIQQSLELHSNFGMLWILFAHVIMNAGYLANLIVANSPSKASVESAMLAGANRMQIRRYIELPFLLPALAPAMLLVALYSATSFGLVRTLGQGLETLETEIAIASLRDLNIPYAIQLGLLQTLMTLGLFVLASKVGANKDIEFGAQAQSRLTANVAATAFGVGYSILLALLLGSILVRPFLGNGIIQNLSLLTSRGARDILNLSLADAAFNSVRNMLVSLLIAVPIAWLVAGLRNRKFWPLIPIGISPVVWGLGTLILIGYAPRFISSSWLVLPVVQAFFLLPLLYQLFRPARFTFSGELSAASAIDGASKWQIFRHIEFPITWPTIRIALGLASLAALGEFGAASFLAFGDQATLPIVLYRLIARPGQENLTMALTAASLFILLSAYVLWLANRDTQSQRQVFQDAL